MILSFPYRDPDKVSGNRQMACTTRQRSTSPASSVSGHGALGLQGTV